MLRANNKNKLIVKYQKMSKVYCQLNNQITVKMKKQSTKYYNLIMIFLLLMKILIMNTIIITVIIIRMLLEKEKPKYFMTKDKDR